MIFFLFTCLIDSRSEIVGFSGLQKSHFPNGYGRVLSKLYYGKSVRANGYRRYPSLATKYMLPYQVSIAKEINLKYIFISFQSNLNRMKFIKSYVRHLNQIFGK